MIPTSAWKVVAILSSIATMVMYAETMLVQLFLILSRILIYHIAHQLNTNRNWLRDIRARDI